MKPLALCAFLFLWGCQKPPSGAAVNANAPSVQRPTASEVFALRSKCAELGENILKTKITGGDLQKEQLSHYEPKTNRCYVRLTVWKDNLGKGDEYFQQYLFDGQTGQMLAAIRRENGVRSGELYSDPAPSQGNPDEMYVDASIFIRQMMVDDRQE